MRFICATLFAATFPMGCACATSIIALPGSAQTVSASIIFLGEPAKPIAATSAYDRTDGMALSYPSPVGLVSNASATVSASIIALGEPAVENFQVAAINAQHRQRARPHQPIVMRGGMSGDILVPSPSATAPKVEPRQANATDKRKAQPKVEPRNEPAQAPALPPSQPSGQGSIKETRR